MVNVPQGQKILCSLLDDAEYGDDYDDTTMMKMMILMMMCFYSNNNLIIKSAGTAILNIFCCSINWFGTFKVGITHTKIIINEKNSGQIT